MQLRVSYGTLPSKERPINPARSHGHEPSHKLPTGLIEHCEISIRKDADGWGLSAKGALALAALLVVAVLTVDLR